MQVGLLAGKDASPRVPLELAIANELELVGSHGLQASYYPALFELVTTGKLPMDQLISKRISLDEAPQAMKAMASFDTSGITVIDRFNV